MCRLVFLVAAGIYSAVAAPLKQRTTAQVLTDTNYQYTFEAYELEFVKVYQNDEERAVRKSAFAANFAEIKAHNSQTPEPTWVMGVNPYTDLTHAEFKATKLGRSKSMANSIPMTAEDHANFEKHHAKDVDVKDLPQSVDWRTKGVVTPVKNQGGCGSCWAFSTAETVESTVAIATGKPPMMLSEEELVDCLPNPQQCGGTGGCEGATQWLGFDFISKKGAATEASYPYTAHDGACKAFTPTLPVGAIGSYVRIPANNYSALINAVVNVGPIAISAAAEPWQMYESGVFSSACNTDVDHAIQLVGYGTDAASGKDYYLVRNSWGATWGEAGYIRIERFGGKGTEPCAADNTPGDGTGCKGGPSSVQVCGKCGILSDSSYPIYGAGPGPSPPGPAPPGPAPPGPPSCGVPAANRTDCGFDKTEDQCTAAGCCYQTSDPRSYRCFNSDTCSSINPADRVDCGYTNTQAQCEAAGCCYDSSVPFTFKCFCKSAGPSPGPSPPTPPGPGPTPPPPPPPPTPPGPAGGHYGDPNKGPCLPDEKAVQINGITGKFCAPSCSTSSPCPAAPAGTTATPQCVVSDPNPPPSLCAVICVPGADFLAAGDGGCMPGAACQAIQGTGVCTYADTNKQTFAFNLPLYLGNDVPVAIV